MEVFLVPAGETRYELYCELSESDQPQRQIGRAHV